MKELGTKLKIPDYSRMLRRIQDDPEDFYQGTTAHEIVEDVQSVGGILTLDDLKNYKVRNNEVLKGRIGNYTLNTVSAPFGGPILLHILKILQGNFVLLAAKMVSAHIM